MEPLKQTQNDFRIRSSWAKSFCYSVLPGLQHLALGICGSSGLSQGLSCSPWGGPCSRKPVPLASSCDEAIGSFHFLETGQ